jgi:hypothetical protein
MKNTLRKTLMACAATAVCAFSANIASAQTALFADFTVDPTGPAANFVADKITGNYVEIANFIPSGTSAPGTFTANLYWKAGAFVANDGTNQINSSTTGLGVNYGIYALYSANGTFTMSGNQTNFTFTPGTGGLSVWLDPTNNTSYVAGSGNDFIGTGTADDIRLANGMPMSGNGYLDPTNSQCTNGIFCGAFGSTTSFSLTGDGAGFFISPSPFYQLSFQSGQLNNFNPSGRQVLNGSLDVTFNGTGGNPVPEPASLALLGLGLVGIGLSRRRRKKA